MSLNDTMKAHMDAVRSVTGDSDKLSIDDATVELQGLTSESIRWSTISLNGTEYDSNTWYPVTSSAYSIYMLDKVIVQKQLYDGDNVTWATHSNSLACLFEVISNANGWGTLPTLCYIFANMFRFTDKNPVAYDSIPDNGGHLLWLRGGAFYHVGISLPNNSWTIHTEEFTTQGGIKVAPTTTAPVTDMSIAKKLEDTVKLIDLTQLGGNS